MLSERFNVFVRSGFHCAQPAHEALNIPPTVRASVYVYNDAQDIESLARGVAHIARHFCGRA
jgi:cysteine desulfurase/selenocysteine lyase